MYIRTIHVIRLRADTVLHFSGCIFFVSFSAPLQWYRPYNYVEVISMVERGHMSEQKKLQVSLMNDTWLHVHSGFFFLNST